MPSSYAPLPSSYFNFGAWLEFSGEDETKKPVQGFCGFLDIQFYEVNALAIFLEVSFDIWRAYCEQVDWLYVLKPFLWVVIYGTCTRTYTDTLYSKYKANGVLFTERL